MKFLDEELLDKYVKSAINQIEDNIDDFKNSFSTISINNIRQTYGELLSSNRFFSFDFYYRFKSASFSPMADYIKHEIERGNIFEDCECFEFIEILSGMFMQDIGYYDIELPFSNIETCHKIVADRINHSVIEDYLLDVVLKLEKQVEIEYDLSESVSKDIFNVVFLHYYVINNLCAELMLQDICAIINEHIDSLSAKINMKEDVR